MLSITEVGKVLEVPSSSTSIARTTNILNRLEFRGIIPRVIPPSDMGRAAFSLVTKNGEQLVEQGSGQNCIVWRNTLYEACTTLLNSINGKKLVSNAPNAKPIDVPNFDIKG